MPNKNLTKIIFNGEDYFIGGSATSSGIPALEGTGVASRDAGSGASPRYIPGKWTFNSGTTLQDGDIFIIKVPVASGSTSGDWVSIDGGTTYHPLVINDSRHTTQLAKTNKHIMIVYDANRAVAVYAENGSNKTSSVTGVFNVINYYDSNTTYSSMSVAEMKAGTVTTARSITAKNMKDAFVAADGVFQTGSTQGSISVYGTDIVVNGVGNFEITTTLDVSKMTVVTNVDNYSYRRGILSQAEGLVVLDKTFAEIKAAIEEGKNVYLKSNLPVANAIIPLHSLNTTGQIVFSRVFYAYSASLPQLWTLTFSISSTDNVQVELYINKPIELGTPEVTVSTDGAVTQELQPDTIYHFTSDALTSLTLTLPTGEETKQYHFDFISPSTAITLTLPQSVEMPQTFSVEANTKYEIDILNSLGIFATWAYEVS